MVSKGMLLVLIYVWMVTEGRRLGVDDEISPAAGEQKRVKRSDDFPASQVELEHLAQQVTKQAADLTALRSQLTHLQASFQAYNAPVAFFAYRASSRFTMTGYGTMLLDRATTNIGSAFDPQSGIFTVPVSGTFAFFLTIRSYSDSSATVDIVVNGSARTRAMVMHSNLQATAHVVLPLRKGDKVWPKNSSSANHDMYGSAYYTHFSGFLVQQGV